MYIWEQKDWPKLTWDNDTLARPLARISREQGRLLGQGMFAVLLSINPTDAYRLVNLADNGAVSQAAGMVGLPAGATMGPVVQLTVLAFWALVPASVAALLLNKREL